MKQFGITYELINGLIALDQKAVKKLVRQIEDLRVKLNECTTNRRYITLLRCIYRRLEFGNAHPLIHRKYWTDPDGISNAYSYGERIHARIKSFESGKKEYRK